MMNIVIDLDDTVCDSDGYSEKYILEFIKEHNLPYKQIAKVVRFAEKKFDWSEEQALDWYKKYGDEMMLNFPCKENAIKVINSLYQAGHKIIIATARAKDWHTEPEYITKTWLEKNNIKYNKIYLGRIDKEQICEDENATVFIDDDVNTTQKVANHFKNHNKNILVLLMTSDYNKQLEVDSKVTRVDNFDDVLTKIVNNNKSRN